jgi:very-short-patch-repair endonuclease
MAHHIDRAIEALARKQHGAFSLAQVIDAGGDRKLAHRRCGTGQWLRLDTAVYALPGNPFTVLRQLKAAELAVPGAYVSGAAAAVVHGLPGIRMGRPEISTHRNGGSTPLARVRHRQPVPTTTVAGIRVTTISQTFADLSGVVDAAVLGPAIDATVLANRTNWDELDAAYRLARARRSPSAKPFAEVLLERDPAAAVPASVLESQLYPLLEDPRLPPFVRQAPAPWDPHGDERVDATFPTVRWIVEGDGRSWHARVADFERDRRRDHQALAVGWSTFRFTATQIGTDGYVVDTLLAALACRREVA